MSDISEQEPNNTIEELSKALFSEIGKEKRVRKHCSKIGTKSAKNKETNLSLVRLMQKMISKLLFWISLNQFERWNKSVFPQVSSIIGFAPILTYWDTEISKLSYRRVTTDTHRAQNAYEVNSILNIFLWIFIRWGL